MKAEDLARAGIEELLKQPDEKLKQAAGRIHPSQERGTLPAARVVRYLTQLWKLG